jgi:signal transduction histidine kinase/CheY-like chemotaxis protein/HPt (histidine-containing phosphotransfer) domain-containing protein
VNKNKMPNSHIAVEVLSKTIEIFTSHVEKSFEDVMAKGLQPIAEAASINRVTIYNRSKSNKGQYGQFYKWDKALGGTAPVDDNLKILPLSLPAVSQWLTASLKGEIVIRRLDKMSKEEISFSNMIGMKSMALIPIFTHGELWGAISFQDHLAERDFDDCIDLLYSVAHLCANAAIREEMQRENDLTIKMLETINKAAIVLISQNEDSYENRMTAGIGLICDIVGLDRLSVWRNFRKPDGLHTSQIYRWDRQSGGTTKPTPGLEDVTYASLVPRWEKLLANDEVPNGPVRLMPEAKVLKSFGCVSALVVPLFIENCFWGFALLEDRYKERYFEENEVKIMRSAAFLCANVVIRAEMERSISFSLEQQTRITEISRSFISYGDSSYLINEALNKLGRHLGVSRIFIIYVDYENCDTHAAFQWYADENVPILQGSSLNIFDITMSIFPKKQPEGATPIVSCADINTTPEERFHMFKARNVTSLMGMPLYIEGNLWGVISAEHCFSPHEWSEDEISFFTTVASTIASAIMCSIYDTKLKETLNKVTNLSKAKDEFLSKISHEIRTPMSAILGITEIQLQDRSLSAGAREGLSVIHNSGDSLLRIINDLLDLSKIEAKKLEIVPDKYEIASLISDSTQLNMMRIESKPIEFKLSIDEDIPTELIGDELRIKQILNNILSNSFKYTDSGEVSLSVSIKKSETENSEITLTFKISDTGQGMTEEQSGKIFDEYFRFNLNANHAIEGTGLGMAITRNLVSLMDGEIFVESEPGKGSTFTVSLPQKIAGTEVLGKEMVESLRKFRINNSSQMKKMQIVRDSMPYGKVLIVDDVESNLYVAKRLLAPYDLSLQTAVSGFEAIDKIKSGKVYDIVFMDHMMPKMDGIETVKKMRELGYAQPIVALTANAVVGQAEIFLENGFNDFISKPIDVIQLNDVLNRFIRDKQSPEAIEEAQKQKSEFSDLAPEANEVDTTLLLIFAKDAKKSLVIFDETLKNIAHATDEDLRLFTIHVHAMKSNLANIGENEASELAFLLENAGKKYNKGLIQAKAPQLIDILNNIIEKIEKETEKNTENIEENTAFLLEQLKIIDDACVNYNARAANLAMAELKKMQWSKETGEFLEKIAEHLLRSEFEEINAIADNYCSKG